LTDSRGLVLAHQSKLQYVIDQTDFSSQPTVREALAGNQGTMRFLDPVEKEWMIGAYLPVRSTESLSSKDWAIGFVIPERIVYGPVAIFTRAIAVFAAISSIVLGFIGFVLIRGFLSPLDQLIAAARTAGSGDFSFRIENPKDDEFATLTQAYNEMASELGESERKIRENETNLRTMNGRLSETNKELEAFSYSVSHDLRAPLRAIDGFSHALVEDFGALLNAEGLDYLTRIRHGVQRMGNLIEDMLKLSRVNRSEVMREMVDLSSMVASQAEELASQEPARDTELVIAPAVTAMADRRLLRILIENLLGNAWKFTKARHKARIEFGLREDRGRHVFFVRDNGAGFDMKYAGRLFSAFQRLHSAAEYEGTGIGLAIVKRIAARHGGLVWAEAAVGVGATFYFTLSGEEAK